MWVIKLSRPRFWGYLAGPFLVGVAVFAGDISPFVSPLFWLWLGFFILPGNIILYGINDAADGDTDAHNDKKQGYESTLKESRKSSLIKIIWLCVILGAILALFSGKVGVVLLYGLWLFLSWAYSATPFRFKARPFLDFMSNGLYILPGVLGFLLFNDANPVVINQYALLGAWAWAGGMHLYSAIPDIEPDRKAGIKTTAVLLGEQKSAYLTMFLFVLAGALGSVATNGLVFALGLVYAGIVWHGKQKGYAKVYKAFPYLNTLVGLVLFWVYFWGEAMVTLKKILGL